MTRQPVGRLTSEHGLGHGHTDALLAATLAGSRWFGHSCDAGT
ncbi:hypothetical protein AB0D11_00035 [Streptomyces monashensis]